MRDILFKAKKKDDGEWVEGSLLQTTAVSLKSFIVPSSCYTFGNWDWLEIAEVDSDTICQYTGLTDKYGAKIWENDICNCAYDGRFATRVIVWDESELDFKGTNGKDNYGKEFDYLGCCEEIEVIGNIFDNAELLEG